MDISTYLLADNFSQLVRIHCVNVIHVELQDKVSTPVTASVAVHGKPHGIQDVVHLLHSRLLEDCPNRNRDPASGSTEDHRGEEYQKDHYYYVSLFSLVFSPCRSLHDKAQLSITKLGRKWETFQ